MSLKYQVNINLVTFNKQHLVIRVPWTWYNPSPYEERVYIVETDTGDLNELTLSFSCEKPFMYKNMLTCVRGNLFEDRELVSLSFDDDSELVIPPGVL